MYDAIRSSVGRNLENRAIDHALGCLSLLLARALLPAACEEAQGEACVEWSRLRALCWACMHVSATLLAACLKNLRSRGGIVWKTHRFATPSKTARGNAKVREGET